MKNVKKTTPMTFRVTPEENEVLKVRAGEKGQSVSQYVSERVFQDQGLTATVKRDVYRHLLLIKDYVNDLDRELKEKIDEECESIWLSLKL